MMNDIALTLTAIVVASSAVWLCTMRDVKVMSKWRHPFWPLARITVFFVSLHVVLVAANVPVVNGYIFLVAFVFVSLAGAFFGPLTVLFAATVWLFYEWVFWFPSRDELVLGNVRPTLGIEEPKGSLDGLIGEAISDLTPAGQVLIGGKIRDSRVSLGFVSKGELVEVESYGAFELIVKKHETPNDQ